MRVLPSVGAAAVAVAATVLLAPAASAHTAAPGDNGTVKIHDATTGEELVKNEPHVCRFYLDAFFFDGEQKADWRIVEMPPTGTKGKLATSGELTPGADGHGRTDDMTLPDGHYKLSYTFDDENGKAKQKVFWTDCADDSGSGGTSTGSTDGGTGDGGTTDGGTSTGTTGGGTAAGGTGDTSGGTAVDDTTSPSPTTSGTGNLAETGASVTGISVLAAGLLAAGVTFAVRSRRRSAQRH